jgi:DNA-binding transcriptional LysR family regulator
MPMLRAERLSRGSGAFFAAGRDRGKLDTGQFLKSRYVRFLSPTSFRVGADNADAQRLILIEFPVHDVRVRPPRQSAMIIAALEDARTVSFNGIATPPRFQILAEERHFGRAAERLGMTQPPLSRQIQQLEAELGVKLFLRNARSVNLTEAGARYLSEIEPHLAGLGRAAATLRATSGKLIGKVRAGFVSNLAYRLMPNLLKAMKKGAPLVKMELLELPGPEQLRMIRERRLDVGFVVLPIADPGLKFRLLVREPLVAVLPENHPMAGVPKVSLKALARENFVFCPRFQATGFHELILDICRSWGFDPHIVHESSSGAATMALVAGGAGISIVTESASMAEHTGIVFKPLAGTSPMIETAAVWLDEAMTPALRTFLDQAIQVAAVEREFIGPETLPDASSVPGRSRSNV